ncbi:hypothetical protein vseg_015760 [Gypsophila vaccaria]
MASHDDNITSPPPRPRKVIFSFTSYAKDVISALKCSTTVHVTAGLTPAEISSVEAAAGVAFPADLRSILAEGLPVGPGFPNWRTPSRHQLRLLTSLPVLSIVKEVSRRRFWWAPEWGPRPEEDEAAVAVARECLAGRVPRLVPIFRHCYVPCEPSTAGNPVFYVHGGDVILVSPDVGEFFKTTKFWRKDYPVIRPENNLIIKPRKIPFWTDVAEVGPTTRQQWWSEGELGLGECLEDVARRLRDGGWGEDDVREMMMVDEDGGSGGGGGWHVRDGEGVARHVRRMSRELLRSGWSLDDVVYSLGDDLLKGEDWVDDIRSNCGAYYNKSLVLSR